jgi:adenosylmethionine-8-amino-7-oxononanoate aminotransferase
MPIGAAIVSGRVTDFFTGPDGQFAHGQTYAGHPPACAVALENIAILEEEALPERAASVGPRLMDGLSGLLDRHANLGYVRGRGLLIGVEILKDAPSGTEYVDKRSAGTAFRLALRDAGVIAIAVHPGNVILLAPPLIISETEIDTMVEMFDAGLATLNGLDLA